MAVPLTAAGARAALALAAATGVLAACGGDESGDGDGATGDSAARVTISADPDGRLAYEQTAVTAPAGALEIVFENPAPIDHDVVVEDADGTELARTDVIRDATATATAEFEPGKYAFYCSVDAHRQAGMKGTLTVE